MRRTSVGSIFLGLLAFGLPLAAAEPSAPRPPKDVRATCTYNSSLRIPLFGETHAHTAYSFDAYSFAVNNPPSEAYEYAKGRPIQITDAMGAPTRCAQLARPLDWAAITDHSEFLGEMTMCLDPASSWYQHPDCVAYRNDPATTAEGWGEGLTVEPPRPPAFCNGGDPNQICRAQSATLWNDIRAAAEAAYDRTSACTFTSFVGYEWTSMPGYNNRHRNVIFRNENVPQTPLSVFDTGNDESWLWTRLSADCLASQGCEALTIPHNGNLSDGMLYTLPPGANAAYAVQRSTWEPLSEIHQGKGNSECRTGVGTTDPECGFEQLVYHNLDFVDFGGPARTTVPDAKPYAPNAFLRNALKDGLSAEKNLGANPFKFGFAGGTDTHSALPGGTDEGNFQGLHGSSTASPEGLLSQVEFNPGALTVVWATENSRDALFDGLKRRETYATSGTRPTVSFFGGWTLPATLCSSGSFRAQGDANGKPMGSDLPARPTNVPYPQFAVQALKDPGSTAPSPLPAGNCAVYKPGAKLQRIEIVKGWLDANGNQHEKVVTVAGSPTLDPAATVDPDTCAPVGPGADSLCTVWTDTEFDPGQRAFYYARVLENPTCRWSTYTCKEAGLDPFQPMACQTRLQGFSKKPQASGGPSLYDTFSACCSVKPGPVVAPTEIPRVTQQRAWTSPIWYSPPAKTSRKAAKP
ncbi:MAG: DUF3604 domain-containing protein [Thermoanaerobaculia bacterium]